VERHWAAGEALKYKGGTTNLRWGIMEGEDGGAALVNTAAAEADGGPNRLLDGGVLTKDWDMREEEGDNGKR
jgi:hypothetical protein